MEMQQIRYFLSLARTLNFTRAAEECNVTQPALTRAIQGLEAELGGPLLRRERQNSHLTELGARMLPLLQRCYDSALSAKQLARSVVTNEVAPLSIAVSHTVSIENFLPCFAELFRAFPGLQLRILRAAGADIVALMREGETDLAIAGPLEEKWGRLDSWPVFAEGFEIAVHESNVLAKSNEIDAAKLGGVTLLYQSGCESREEIIQRLGLPRGDSAGHQVVTHHDLLALLDTNLGVAIVPASAPQRVGVRRIPLAEAGLRTVSVYAVAGRERSPAGGAFLNLLRSKDWSREDR